jgi:hypothetical protein
MIVAADVLAEYDVWFERRAPSAGAAQGSAYRRWLRELVEHLQSGDELEASLAVGGWRCGRSTSRWPRRRCCWTRVRCAAPEVRRVEVNPMTARALSRQQLRAPQRDSDRLRSSGDHAILVLLKRAAVK